MEFKRTNKENILIIDDVTSNLLVLSDIIRAADCIARPVPSVELAMKAIDAELPNLILLDVTMPQMNGFEYCRILKDDVRTRDIPVIFISGLSSPEDHVKGFENGAVDFITKPFERTEVLMRVNTHLRTYRMHRELVISNKKLHNLVSAQLRQIEEERKNMALGLAELAEDRDDGTGQHLVNISKNSRLIATGLSLTHKYEKVINSEFINTIEIASKLHDIGKMAIPDKILLKEGPLSGKDRSIMMMHTIAGVETLNGIYAKNSQNGFIKMAIDIAYYHHEKWDGSGYPCGLEGAGIPLSARIMAVVDTYDALVSERCYKAGYSHEKAIEIIRGESGKSFDPDIVNIFCRLGKHLKRSESNTGEDDLKKKPGYDAMEGRR